MAVREAAQDGKAQSGFVDILADHFGVAKPLLKLSAVIPARHKPSKSADQAPALGALFPTSAGETSS